MVILRTPLVEKSETLLPPLPLSPPSPPSLPPRCANAQKFSWTQGHEMDSNGVLIGCLQLEDPGPDDDLYVINITLVSVENLEQLLQKNPPAMEDCQWIIQFDCFGMTIDSDIFTLDYPVGTRQHFLGDKSTVRVRASEKEFNRFLSDFVLEVKIESVRDFKTELLGTAWTELKSLTQPDIFEIRPTTEIVPQKLVTVHEDFTPQLFHIIDVKKCSRLFDNFNKRDAKSFTGTNENLSRLEFQNDVGQNKPTIFETDDEKLRPDFVGDDYEGDLDLTRTIRKLVISEAGAGDKVSLSYKLPGVQECAKQENGAKSKGSRTNVIDIEKRPLHSTLNPSPGKPALNSHASISGFDMAPCSVTILSRKENLTISPLKNKRSIRCSSNGAIPKIPDCCQPGDYDLSLKFIAFNIKSNVELKNDWILSFFHPPLSVEMDDRCELHAKISRTKDRVTTFHFQEGNHGSFWEVSISKFSSEILNTPLRVNFHTATAQTESSALKLNHPIAYSDIPLGNIFTAKEEEWGRRIKGTVKISKNSRHNSVRIGYLSYEFTLEEADKDVRRETAGETFFTDRSGTPESDGYGSPELFTPINGKHGGNGTITNIIKEKSETSKAARLEFLQDKNLINESNKDEKEKPTIQILPQEHEAQTEEIQKNVHEKLDELEMKIQLFHHQVPPAKGNRLSFRAPEAEMKDTSEMSKIIEDLKFHIRQLENQGENDIFTVNGKLDAALTELEITNGQILVLQSKIDAKDEIILKLQDKPNSNLHDAEIDKLKQQNIQFEKELKSAVEENAHYRSQLNKMANELRLKSEQESSCSKVNSEPNRKLTFISNSNSHSVPRSCSSNTTSKKRHPPGDFDMDPYNVSRMIGGNQSTSHQDQEILDIEIERLSKRREDLLSSQAYTSSHWLISKIEAEIMRHLQQKTILMEASKLRRN